jgi:hypothetical protein
MPIRLCLAALILATTVACGTDGDDSDACAGSSCGDSAPADVLLLVDNSSSVADAGAELALSAPELFAALGSFDVQVGVATISDGGGELVGAPASTAEDLRQQLLCSATCFVGNPPSDPSYTCGDEPTSLSVELLDCECGTGTWEGNCGGGTEMGLEAALTAMCLASSSPPGACEAPGSGTDPGLLRDGASLAVLLVTDEGDTSPRLAQGDASADVYVDAYDAFGIPYVWHVVGPDLSVCNSGGATDWGILRYQQVVDTTGGSYTNVRGAADCGVPPFSDVFEALAGSL